MKIADLRNDECEAYYKTYLKAAGNIVLLDGLTSGKVQFIEFMRSIPEEKLTFQYDVGKWSIAEVLRHIVDAERVFQFRAFCFSKNDTTPLPSFDQDHYVLLSRANEMKLDKIISEYESVRNATSALFNGLNNEELLRTGTASDLNFSVRALGFIICGHQAHHKKIIMERYLD